MFFKGLTHNFEIEKPLKNWNPVSQNVPVDTAASWAEQVMAFCRWEFVCFDSYSIKQEPFEPELNVAEYIKPRHPAREVIKRPYVKKEAEEPAIKRDSFETVTRQKPLIKSVGLWDANGNRRMQMKRERQLAKPIENRGKGSWKKKQEQQTQYEGYIGCSDISRVLQPNTDSNKLDLLEEVKLEQGEIEEEFGEYSELLWWPGMFVVQMENKIEEEVQRQFSCCLCKAIAYLSVGKNYAQARNLKGRRVVLPIAAMGRDVAEWETQAWGIELVDRKRNKYWILAFEIKSTSGHQELTEVKEVWKLMPASPNQEVLEKTHVTICGLKYLDVRSRFINHGISKSRAFLFPEI